MCLSVCTGINKNVCICVGAYMLCMYVCIYLSVCECKSACMHVCVNAWTCACMHIPGSTLRYAHACTYMCAHEYACVGAHVSM